jgi:hypothetical protein
LRRRIARKNGPAAVSIPEAHLDRHNLAKEDAVNRRV